MQNDVWVLSADTHKARLFKVHDPNSEKMEEIKTFLHPDTVLPERELVSDLPGRQTQRGGQAHAKLPRTSPKEKRILEFARDVAEFLENQHKVGAFYKLGIVAAPGMLGELRAQFSEDLARDITFEIDKNFTQLRPDELRKHLPQRLAPGLH